MGARRDSEGVEAGGGEGGGGEHSFDACRSHLTVENGPLSRLSAIPTPSRDTFNVWARIPFFRGRQRRCGLPFPGIPMVAGRFNKWYLVSVNLCASLPVAAGAAFTLFKP